MSCVTKITLCIFVLAISGATQGQGQCEIDQWFDSIRGECVLCSEYTCNRKVDGWEPLCQHHCPAMYHLMVSTTVASSSTTPYLASNTLPYWRAIFVLVAIIVLLLLIIMAMTLLIYAIPRIELRKRLPNRFQQWLLLDKIENNIPKQATDEPGAPLNP